MLEALQKAHSYYQPICRDASGEFSEMYVDEYGSGIKHDHWEAMKAAGWWKYVGGSWICGGFETWCLTEKGQAAMLVHTTHSPNA